MIRLFQILLIIAFVSIAFYAIVWFIGNNIDFKVDLKSVNPSNIFNAGELKAKITVSVKNNNPFGLPAITNPNVKIYYGSPKKELIAETVKYNQTLVIGSGQNVQFQREFNVYLNKEFFEAIKKVNTNTKPEFGYNFTGIIAFIIPINYKGTFIYE